MSDFTPLSGLLGGALIGLSASLLLLGSGRIAGVSGIAAGALFSPGEGQRAWRLAFLVGLVAAGVPFVLLAPAAIEASPRPLGWLAVAGLLVGVGTRLGSGCTSGHGVCGVSRLSPRSLMATALFVGTAMLTVAALRFGLGAAP
ncbi:MAG TPA: YeeE/YedE family protein [Polyangiaceae bacterium]|nr:YeeE/YedE family protein [Polyangiaceae bacterium]